MRRTVLIFISTLISVICGAQSIFYDTWATSFEEGTPLGNGHIGLMIYGSPFDQTVALNESTLWGGCANTDNDPNPDGPQMLESARNEIRNGNYREAADFCFPLQGRNANIYAPMGKIKFIQDIDSSSVSLYRRSLDIDKAIYNEEYESGGVKFTKECFVSYPSRLAIFKISSSELHSLSFSLKCSTPWPCSETVCDDGTLIVKGQLGAYMPSNRDTTSYIWVDEDGRRGMRYQYRIKVVQCDGKIETGDGIKVSGATQAVIALSAATSFNGPLRRPDIDGKDEAAIAASALRNAERKSYSRLLREHISDYQSIYGKSSFHIDYPSVNIPMDKRVEAYKNGSGDIGLENIFLNFCKYVTIASNREDGVVTNIQGIWCEDIPPKWGCNYTINVNTQMNYWPLDLWGMGESIRPLFNLVYAMSLNGAEVSRNLYGTSGWTAHHNSDIWGMANPVGEKRGAPRWANWPMGGVWLLQNLYDHYLFTLDRKYLESLYPLMKGAGEFVLDFLVEKDGFLTTMPSTSPENTFIDINGFPAYVSYGSAMDLSLCRELLANLSDASSVLGKDARERDRWLAVRDSIAPYKINSQGGIMEWGEDHKEKDTHHRHTSHLYGLYPGTDISVFNQDSLSAAARKTLELRGESFRTGFNPDGSIIEGATPGWCNIWRVLMRARLLDTDRAYNLFKSYVSGNVLPSLLNSHPPFQIDGNYGALAALAEMLIQSQNGELHILPSLPEPWKNGSVSGVHARGGYELSVSWNDGTLASATILSSHRGECRIRTSVPVEILRRNKVIARSKIDGEWYVTEFSAKRAKKYSVRAAF